jgi:hypothetical protein
MPDDADREHRARDIPAEETGATNGPLLVMFGAVAAVLALLTVFGLGSSGSPLWGVVVGVTAFALLVLFARPRRRRR